MFCFYILSKCPLKGEREVILTHVKLGKQKADAQTSKKFKK